MLTRADPDAFVIAEAMYAIAVSRGASLPVSARRIQDAYDACATLHEMRVCEDVRSMIFSEARFEASACEYDPL